LADHMTISKSLIVRQITGYLATERRPEVRNVRQITIEQPRSRQ
jgi:hypothetical protein